MAHVGRHNTPAPDLLGRLNAERSRPPRPAPTDDAVLRNVAMALLETGHTDDAAPYAERAARLRPENAASHDVWGEVLFAQHKIQAALEQLQIALTLNPAAADIRAHLDEVRKQSPR
jgi:tetratricopeptide (TPR) repeat protein